MALTPTRQKEVLSAPLKATRIQVDFDASYPTGGEILSVSNFIRGATVMAVIIPPRDKYSFEYDIANDKIKVYTLPTVAAVDATDPANASYTLADQTDLAKLANELKADINAGREEVPNTTNLSTLTGVEVLIFHFGS